LLHGNPDQSTHFRFSPNPTTPEGKEALMTKLLARQAMTANNPTKMRYLSDALSHQSENSESVLKKFE
jgi:hypothetical protein